MSRLCVFLFTMCCLSVQEDEQLCCPSIQLRFSMHLVPDTVVYVILKEPTRGLWLLARADLTKSQGEERIAQDLHIYAGMESEWESVLLQLV